MLPTELAVPGESLISWRHQLDHDTTIPFLQAPSTAAPLSTPPVLWPRSQTPSLSGISMNKIKPYSRVCLI